MDTLVLEVKMKDNGFTATIPCQTDDAEVLRNFIDDLYDITHLWAFESKKAFSYSLRSDNNMVNIENADWQKEINIYDIFVSAVVGEDMNTSSLTPYEMEKLVEASINQFLACRR